MTDFEKQLITIVVAQLPFVIYQIWNGVKRNKPEIKKTEAEEEAALSDAVAGAGKTLEGAWKRIDELASALSTAELKIRQLEDELRRWRNYAARLIKQLKQVSPDTEPVGFETEPFIFKRKDDK